MLMTVFKKKYEWNLKKLEIFGFKLINHKKARKERVNVQKET